MRRPIDLNKLPSNNKIAPNRRAAETNVTTGKVKTRSTSGGLAREVRNIGNSLFAEVVMPALKATIVDFFNNGINMALYKNEAPTHRSSPRSYNRMHGRAPRTPRSIMRPHRGTPDISEDFYEDIFFDKREDAMSVLGRMMELVAEYGTASIGDLYSLVGLASNYTHQRWGWDDLNRCKIHYTSDGYVIDFPEPGYFN